MKEDFISRIKCINKVALALKLVATGVVVASTVYSLIPKYDKITGVDTDALIQGKKASAEGDDKNEEPSVS